MYIHKFVNTTQSRSSLVECKWVIPHNTREQVGYELIDPLEQTGADIPDQVSVALLRLVSTFHFCPSLIALLRMECQNTGGGCKLIKAPPSLKKNRRWICFVEAEKEANANKHDFQERQAGDTYVCWKGESSSVSRPQTHPLFCTLCTKESNFPRDTGASWFTLSFFSCWKEITRNDVKYDIKLKYMDRTQERNGVIYDHVVQ